MDWQAVTEWLTALGVQNVDKVTYPLKLGTNAEALIALCGKRCYNSFEVGLNPNVTKIREDMAAYLTNVLSSGHGSVLEHATWTFAIENVSRVFTGEMNRHRAGVAISEGSMRYIRFDDVGYTTPGIISPENDILAGLLTADMTEEEVREAKAATRQIFDAAFNRMEAMNVDLTKIWKLDELKAFSAKKVLTSMFRRIIGMGISTGGVWTMNARSLRHIIAMRASIHAEEEIFHVFDRIATMMAHDEPLLFGDFEKGPEGWKPKYPKV